MNCQKPHKSWRLLDNTRSSFILIIGIILIVAAFIGLTWVNYHFSVENPGGNDFLARWMGARYWIMKGISPYDKQVSLATQIAIYGHPADPKIGEDLNHFVYPFTAMIFFAPFGMLEFLPARALWMTLLEICLFVLAIISLRLAEWRVSAFKAGLLALFSVLWYHGMRTILVGQFAAINALLVVVALFMIQRKMDFFAGLFLALATAKPQMVYLVILFVLIWAFANRRREIVWGFLSVGGLLLAISLLFIPDWPLQMIRQLLEYPTYTQIGSPLSIIASTMPGINQKVSLFLHGSMIIYLLTEWVLALKKDTHWFLWTVLMTFVITNLITIRTATTNYVMLLPVLFLIFRIMEDRWGRGGKLVEWLIIGLLSLGLWWLFLTSVQGNQESPIMYIPLPIFGFIGLLWVRWWYLNPPRVFMDQIPSRIE